MESALEAEQTWLSHEGSPLENEGSYKVLPSTTPEPRDCIFHRRGVVIVVRSADTSPLQQMEPTNSFYQTFKKVHTTTSPCQNQGRAEWVTLRKFTQDY